jgi:hypothetical protein
MEFLNKVSPSISWKDAVVTVYTNNKKFILPTCAISSIKQTFDDNSF